MPAIRLADIPNAGPQSIAPAGVALQRLSVPGFQVNPQIAQLTGAAAVDTAPIDRAARSMLTQTLELDAFSQEARAAGKLGEAIQQIGNVAMEYQQKFAKAKDTADTARAETLLQATWQKQQNDQLGKPSEKWGEIWNRNLETAKRGLGEIKFSNDAANSILPYFKRWSTIKSLEIDGQRKKEQIAGFRKDIEAASLAKVAQEDFEGAITIMNNSVSKGIHSAAEATDWSARLLDNIARKAKVERNANIEAAIILDPQKWEKDFSKGLETGKSELQPDASKEEIVRFFPFVRQQSRNAEVEKISIIENMVADGQFKSREELEKALDDKTRPDLMPNVALPERAKQSLLASFEQSPERQAEAVRLIPALIAKIDAYDPYEDQNLDNYIALASTTRMLPEGFRREPLDLLYDKFRAFKESRKPVSATALSQIKKMATKDLDSGGYGKWESDENGLPTDSTHQAYVEANLRYSQEMTALENWAKANPGKAQSDTEVYRAYNDIITQQNKLDAAAGRNPTRKPVDYSSPKKPNLAPNIPDPDEVLRSSPTGASATGKPVGKVTSYNFPGDPYSDTNSRNLIGAWNNTLTESSLAISPDIEKKFKAAGIKQGDAVELTLANGTRVVRNWDDRTMQDEQAIRKFGKPLRGRFDFHQPGGKYENDGIAVVSFRKATAA